MAVPRRMRVTGRPMGGALVVLTGLALCLALSLGLLGCAAHNGPDEGPLSVRVPAPRNEELADVGSWAFAIGDGALEGPPEDVAARLGIFDLVVIDGEEATVQQIAALADGGTLVLAYLSVGTVEPWRSWYATLKPFALDQWGDWDEYYADVNEPGYRSGIRLIADSMMDKGFDGLFLDNVDMVESHRSRTEGMRVLVSNLSGLAKRRGALLFAQNGDDFALMLAPLLDGWNREEVTFGYDFDTASYVRVPGDEREAALAALESMQQAGVLVTSTDYVNTPGSADERDALRVAADIGALPYVSDVELERIPRTPFTRPQN